MSRPPRRRILGEDKLTSIRLDRHTVSTRLMVPSKSPFGNMPCAHNWYTFNRSLRSFSCSSAQRDYRSWSQHTSLPFPRGLNRLAAFINAGKPLSPINLPSAPAWSRSQSEAQTQIARSTDPPINVHLGHHAPLLPRWLILAHAPRFIRLAIRRREVERVIARIKLHVVEVVYLVCVGHIGTRDLEGGLCRRRWQRDGAAARSDGRIARREEQRFTVSRRGRARGGRARWPGWRRRCAGEEICEACLGHVVKCSLGR